MPSGGAQLPQASSAVVRAMPSGEAQLPQESSAQAHAFAPPLAGSAPGARSVCAGPPPVPQGARQASTSFSSRRDHETGPRPSRG
eukprot:11196968-Heterocapsa_arctica.AAC.1